MSSMLRAALISYRPFRRRSRVLVGLLVGAISLSTASAYAASGHVAKASVAKVVVGKVTVKGAKLTVAGRVTLPVDTAKERKRALVSLTLTGYAGKAKKTEAFTAKLTGKDTFTATHTTKLSGALGLSVVVRINGKASGKKVIKTVSVAASTTVGSGSPTPGTVVPGVKAPGSPGSPTAQGTTLNGTFELEAGADVAATGAIGGSYFQMITTEGVPLTNSFSTLANQNYTPLSPGTDGGLETFQYQPGPVPAFDHGTTGNALAARIMQPQDFFGDNFSIVSEASDEQNGAADPLPRIVDLNGALSGQLSSWVVGWNGQWFNQGTPKPDGSLPSGTTALSGTYDATSGHYVLEWKSLIVGGPFNGFQGSWHLEGSFVPAG
jgi:hypothetical protein